MNLKYQHITLLFFVFFAIGIKAQQAGLSGFGQHNSLSYNAAGIVSDVANVELITRQQWFGVHGAPRLAALLYQAPINEGKSFAAQLYTDKNGYVISTGAKASYVYRLRVAGTAVRPQRLSFGLTASLQQNSVSTADFVELGDPLLTGGLAYNVVPNFDASVLYSTNRWYAGVSGLNLIPRFALLKNTTAQFRKPEMLIHGLVGGATELTGRLYLLGEMQVGYQPEIKQVFVAGKALFYLNKQLILGLGKQQDATALVFAGLHFANYRIMYSADYGISAIHRSNYGSHTVSLRYYFRKRLGQVPCPAYL